MSRAELKLLPRERYTGVNRNDPIRFYYYPVIGRLYRRRVEMCLEELAGGEKILEVGFGTGLTFLNLREKYREIHGVDLTTEIDPVAQLWRDEGIPANLRRGNVLELPYEDNSFDAVLLISILEHLLPSDLPRAMSQIRRVLKPGGQLVYGVPFERKLMTLMFRVLGYDIRAHHFSTHQDVRAAANASGLREVRVGQMKGTGGITGPVYEVGHFTKT